MRFLSMAALVVATALLLSSCNNNDMPEVSNTTTVSSSSAASSTIDLTTDSSAASQTPTQSVSDTSPTETSTTESSTTSQPPATSSTSASDITTASSEWVELTPDPDSPETLTISISSLLTSKLKYTPEQKNNSLFYTDNSITISSSTQKNKLITALNGLVFVSVSEEQSKTEKTAFEAWQSANPDIKTVPETLTFLDRSGNEIITFTSDMYISLASGETSMSFSRAFVDGKEYMFFYGELDRTMVNNLLLSQLLINNSYLSLEILGQFALNKVSASLTEFVSTTPEYRVYSPDASLVGDDGTVIYPSSFPAGTLLVDCTFTWANGNKTIATLNAENGTVYQTKTVSA